mmetsp:Transcript_26370/g.38957  ORF Transcript_26370/g.38957 Transcript_26370/m.38957 type:complete len:463 (-) Transcript_26370:51-1439(-)|eukprot:CAMPEP_0194201614 /NCGR_PEP_ID=MMETSP0156-20130528/1828_1 /TAXON_ID=33649 /ORGANISM="Thalassionema nitzschioides, Strain L26-B" /LENGTH=462 /DNA_ID=CAMNT_0038926841 /DNA_START=79 /DNA_END=1467 /DNA_ORIENTATION=+
MVYPKFNPLRDVISGTIMAATSVPQLIAYAETVGYAGYRGLSTAGPTLLAWGLSTGSPFMNSGVTSVTALMCKTDLDGESFTAKYGEEEYVKLVAVYSLYIGLTSILLAIVGFGKLAKNVPKPVSAGFKWGCAVGVLVSAVPNGLFANGSKELKGYVAESVVGDYLKSIKASFPAATGVMTVTNFFFGLSKPQLWSNIPTIIFILGTVFTMKGKEILPKAFPTGTEVIIVTAAATIYSMNFDYPGAVVGEIPDLDPDAGMSFFSGKIRIPIEILDIKELVTDFTIVKQFGSWIMLLVSATLFSAVNFLSIMGIASGFEVEDGIPWSAPRELIAQGVSNFAAAAVGSAPVSGSMSRSLVSRMTGTTSQMACLITAIFWIYLLPYMGIMSPTPKAALSAIIVSAVIKGVCVPKNLMKMTGTDAVVGWCTGILTSFTSPTIGFGGGLVLYLALSPFMPKTKQKEA